MIVLDTHAWLWWASDERRLFSPKTLDAIDAADAVGVCTISCWELMMLITRERVRLNLDPSDWFSDAMALPTLRMLPLTPPIAITAGSFGDKLHGDPADRIIVATTQHHDAQLITRDDRITRAGLVPIIW